MAKILVIDDEPVFHELIKEVLVSQHNVVDVATNGDEALAFLKMYKYDLLLLDWELPGRSGIEICREYRSKGGNTPILMLTAHSRIEDKEEGFDAGTDDYLPKPFDVRELIMRVNALLRRKGIYQGEIYKVGQLELDSARHTIRAAGQDIQLLPKEFALLEFLMKHPNQTYSSEALLQRVWPAESDASPDSIRTYIKRVRKKIDIDGAASILKTVHGIGYKIEDSVEPASET